MKTRSSLITCKKCATQLKLPPGRSTTKLRCPNCKQVFDTKPGWLLTWWPVLVAGVSASLIISILIIILAAQKGDSSSDKSWPGRITNQPDSKPLITFCADKDAQPQTLSVLCQISSRRLSYHVSSERGMHIFANTDDYHSVKIREKGPSHIAWAFIRKETSDGDKMYGILKDGKEHLLRLEMHYEDTDNNFIVIDRLLD